MMGGERNRRCGVSGCIRETRDEECHVKPRVVDIVVSVMIRARAVMRSVPNEHCKRDEIV